MCWPAVAAALPRRPGRWSRRTCAGAAPPATCPVPPGCAGTPRTCAGWPSSSTPTATGELVLAGHSMGAYVALLAVDARPDLFRRLVLVDGGVPLPLPAGVDPDDVLAATLGPALERLQPHLRRRGGVRRVLPPAPRARAALERRRRGLRALRRARDRRTGCAPGRSRRRCGTDGRDLLVLRRRARRRPARAARADAPALRPARHVRRGSGPAARCRGHGVRRPGGPAHRGDRPGRQPLHDPVRPGRAPRGSPAASPRRAQEPASRLSSSRSAAA